MGRADVCNHSNIRLSADTEALDLTKTTHAHLQDKTGMVAVTAQDGAGNTNIVVLVADAAFNRAQRSQTSFDQLTGCCFPCRTRDGNNWTLKLPAPSQGDLLVCAQGVIDHHSGQLLWHIASPITGDQCPCYSNADCRIKEVMTIKAFSS